MIPLAKAQLPAVPDSLLSATESSLIPISLLKNCLPACVQHCSHCLCSLRSQPL